MSSLIGTIRYVAAVEDGVVTVGDPAMVTFLGADADRLHPGLPSNFATTSEEDLFQRIEEFYGLGHWSWGGWIGEARAQQLRPGSGAALGDAAASAASGVEVRLRPFSLAWRSDTAREWLWEDATALPASDRPEMEGRAAGSREPPDQARGR